ncbi:MAG: MFS transporter [Nitrospiraceae bacterium]|nr:MAG: MFS transporter [Nitrospiraceae bacterium]
MTSSHSFILLCGTGLLCFMSYNLVRMPVLALFAQSLGAGPEAIGFIVSVSTLTGVFLKLPSGALSDIYGRRLLLQVGVLAFGLPPFIYPFVSDLNALTGLRFVHGLATALFAPSALATVAELFRERRGAALGTYTACTQAGALLGPMIGGWLVYAAGFSATFATAGAFGCIGLLVFYSLRLNPPPPSSRDKGLRPVLAEMWTGFSVVARNTRVLVTSLTDAAKMVANGALMAFLPIYGTAVGLNPGEVGMLFGVQGITSFLSKPIMGRVSDRVGRQPLILLGLLICATTFALIPSIVNWPILLMLSAWFGFGEAVVSSSSSALVADSSQLKTLGAGMGMQGTIMDVGHAGGPLLAGFLIANLSYQGAFTIIAGLQLAAAAIFWVTMRKR